MEMKTAAESPGNFSSVTRQGVRSLGNNRKARGDNECKGKRARIKERAARWQCYRSPTLPGERKQGLGRRRPGLVPERDAISDN